MEREKVKPEKNNKVDMCPAPAVQERILPEEPIPEDNYDWPIYIWIYYLCKYFCTHSQYSNIKKVSNCIYIN